jgi:hypothetical protein
MSFLKKLKSEFDEIFGDDKKKEAQPAQDVKPSNGSKLSQYTHSTKQQHD